MQQYHRLFAFILATVTVAVLGLAGCMSTPTVTQGQAKHPAPQSAETSSYPTDGESTAPADEETEEPADDEEDDSPDVATFSDSYTYEDGLKVEITKVGHTTVSEWAAADNAHIGDDVLVFTVRLTNGSSDRFDASDLTADASYGADGDVASEVFDSEKGLDGGFDGPSTITPGHRKSVKLGFVVAKKHWKDVTLEVTPGFDYSSAVFQGSVKDLVK
jgi:hypothetical protein